MCLGFLFCYEGECNRDEGMNGGSSGSRKEQSLLVNLERLGFLMNLKHLMSK